MTGWRDSPTQVLLSQADLLETLIATNSAMGEGFAIIDGGRIMVANDAFCHISGYAAEELRALPSFLHLVHPDERALVADRHARRMAGEEQPSRYRSRLVTKDGRSVPIELGVSRVPNCSRVVIIFRDLTLQTQIEESLRESEAKFRALFERSVVGVYRSTCGGRIVECNDAFARIFGHASREAALRQPASGFHAHPELRERFIERLCEAGTLINWEMEARRADGSTVWVLEHVTLLPGGDGPDREMQGTIIDITERKRAEEALRASEQQYRELFENANDIIYTHDLDGRFTSLNSAGEQITGYTREEAQALTVFDVVAPEHLDRIRELMGRDFERQPVTTFTIDIVAKDRRHVPLEVSARIVRRDGRPAGVQGIARDLTDRIMLEAQLRQAQKMEAIGRLAGGVAHDFNNMLMAIRGYSELLHQDLRPDDPTRAQIGEIINAADRAASLTRQLLAFGRKQVLRFRVIDLDAVLRNMERMLRRIIGEDIELVTRTGTGQATINADPGQIEQVIINLALNARDAMPRGGRLVLECGRVDFNKRYARSHVGVRPGPHVVLTVSDTGVGMDGDTLAHLFEPFYTTKEVGKGTGLGLSTAYGIVQQCGGHVSVTSAPGKGTTFRLYFAHIAEHADPENGRELRQEIAGGTETVLLVEDDASVRHLVRQVLRRKGYHVLEAQQGAEALRLCEGHDTQIQLMITDVVMPEMSGRELVARLRTIRPALRVIYMSGYTDDAVVRHGVAEAGIAFLQKPFTPDVLLTKVRRVLDGEREG